MKKMIFAVAIILATSCASCTKDDYSDNTVEYARALDLQANDLERLREVCKIIVDVNIEFDYYQNALPTEERERLMKGDRTLELMIYAINLWWDNDETWETLHEMPEFDEFKELTKFD